LLTHGCIPDLVYRYLNAKEEQDTASLDTSCVRQIPRPVAWYAPLPSVRTPPAGAAVVPDTGAKP